MTYAPQSLLDARAYLQDQTGLPWVSLGIVGSAGHHRSGTSYHIGWSHLETWAYSRQHPRDTALRTEAASALDVGQWSASGLRALTAYVLAQARAGRLPDVRAIIGPASDGRAYRWDRHDSWRGRQRARGDSHETHLHVSYYRDSEHRSKVEPFRDFFEGDDMDQGDIVRHTKYNVAFHLRNTLRGVDQNTDQLAEIRATVRTLAGEDQAEVIRQELDQHRGVLLAEVAERLDGLGDRLAEALPDVPAEQVRAAVAAELADLRLVAESTGREPV